MVLEIGGIVNHWLLTILYRRKGQGRWRWEKIPQTHVGIDRPLANDSLLMSGFEMLRRKGTNQSKLAIKCGTNQTNQQVDSLVQISTNELIEHTQAHIKVETIAEQLIRIYWSILLPGVELRSPIYRQNL